MLLWNIGMPLKFTAFISQENILFIVTPVRTSNLIFAGGLKGMSLHNKGGH
jgi:hypothetical protein